MCLFGKKKKEEYENPTEIVRDGITVILEEDCKNPEKVFDEYLKLYNEKRPELLKFVLENGLVECYGEMDLDTVKEKLGNPTINVSLNEISFCDNTFDGEHIISFEYADGFKKFYHFRMDG